MRVRGSNRAVEEFTQELERAEHDLRDAQARIATLREHSAGPTEPAGCCYRWEWGQDRLSPNWRWQRRVTCGVYQGATWEERCCDHPHHEDDASGIILA